MSDRADGLLAQAIADRDRLKHDLELEKLARDDADRRFAESAMALSRANGEIESLKLQLEAAESPPFTRRRLQVERDEIKKQLDDARAQRDAALEQETRERRRRIDAEASVERLRESITEAAELLHAAADTSVMDFALDYVKQARAALASART